MQPGLLDTSVGPLALQHANAMDVDAGNGAHAAVPPSSSKRHAPELDSSGSRSGDSSTAAFASAASPFLAAPFKLFNSAFTKAIQQQEQQYSKLLKASFQVADKVTSLQAMKDAGQLPKNLQLQKPIIYGEGMDSVQQAADTGVKQLELQLLNDLITAVTQQQAAAQAAVLAAREGAAAAVKAACPALPPGSSSQFSISLLEQIQSAALMELELRLNQAQVRATAAAQRKQQQAQEKAAAAAAVAAAAAPLTAEEQMRRVATEVVRQQMQQQRKKQQRPAAAPPAGGAQQQPRQQRPARAPAPQGRARPAGRGRRPQAPANQQPQQQQQQQQGQPRRQQRPQQRRQGPAHGGASNYADAARGASGRPNGAGQRPSRPPSGRRF